MTNAGTNTNPNALILPIVLTVLAAILIYVIVQKLQHPPLLSESVEIPPTPRQSLSLSPPLLSPPSPESQSPVVMRAAAAPATAPVVAPVTPSKQPGPRTTRPAPEERTTHNMSKPKPTPTPKPKPKSKPRPDLTPNADAAPRYVFIDIAKQNFLNDPLIGRVVIELYADIAPKTVHNFVALCTNKKYVNTPFHRIVAGFMIQGGDIVNQDGTGVYSVYGGESRTFADETFQINHDEKGIVSMANQGPHTNGSQFFITTAPAPHLDGKHVAFGKVVRGMSYIHDLEKELTDPTNRPIRRCYILDCGISTTRRGQVSDVTNEPSNDEEDVVIAAGSTL